MNLQKKHVIDTFSKLYLDVAIIAAYGIILPKEILAKPRFGCMNIHASLLPRWRGAAPIQNAIRAGDPNTGITIMQMDEGLDTGPILLKQSIPIESSDTGETLHRSLSEIGATLIVETLENLEIGNLTASPQTQEGATYAKKLNPEAAQLDWTQSAFDLERQIRAFKPWPGSWFEYEGIRIKVITAETKEESGQPE